LQWCFSIGCYLLSNNWNLFLCTWPCTYQGDYPSPVASSRQVSLCFSKIILFLSLCFTVIYPCLKKLCKTNWWNNHICKKVAFAESEGSTPNSDDFIPTQLLSYEAIMQYCVIIFKVKKQSSFKNIKMPPPDIPEIQFLYSHFFIFYNLS
jgi:hypothetical protein